MVNHETYKIRAQAFIKQIFPFIINCDDHAEREIAITKFNEKYHRNVLYKHGMTRFCMITSDYVIKVDFDNFRIQQFGGCENEVAMYEQAKTDGFEHLFAEITPYKYNNCTFYIMPRINHIGEFCGNAEMYMTEDESDWCYNHGLFDLHNENYGWINNHVVLVDYAAY